MKGQSPETPSNKLSSTENHGFHPQDDEIDLLQLLLELWKGRKIILLSVVIFILIGLSYVVTKPNSYIVSVGYKVEIYQSEALKLCQKEKAYKECLDSEALSQYSDFLPSWRVDTEKLMLSRPVSQESQNLGSYQRELDTASANVKRYLLDKTRKSLSVMDSLNPILQGTEIVAESILQARKILSLLEDEGRGVVTFGKPRVKKEPAKSSLIIILSAFLGVFLGIFTVLFRKVFKEFKLRIEADSLTEKK